MLLQSALLCSMVILSTICFSVCQYITLSWFVYVFLHMAWIFLAGSAVLVHILLN
uniref:NADH dehydrogenase subunit 2 n=1 Tax=Romanomermis culicivorax TaxID=13658 RepID=A0A915KWN0_ROMCU